MKQIRRTFFIGMLTLACMQAAVAQHTEHQHGKVDFPISCNAQAKEQFSTGLALLHHMMYEQAEAAFKQAAEADPTCSMAHWGVAMSIIHPLWGERPNEAMLKKGQEALARARELKPPTEREVLYVAALEPFFTNWEQTTYPAQLQSFEAGFKKVHDAFPDDIDAAAFYALGMLATASPSDKTFSRQKAAGELLEQLHARAPEHPGLFHYIIHSYDNPVLAERAVSVARAYDKLAPDVPHALHMPSHIFVRLGYWDDAINWNRRSAAAALRQPVGDQTSMHYAHALDYMMYALLQQGQDAEARKVLDQMMAVKNLQQGMAAAYAFAAIPARYPLERARWADAAAISLPMKDAFPWDKYPGAESIVHFARGLGAAHSNDLEGARNEIAELERLHTKMTASGDKYWSVLNEAQRKTVEAWMAFEEGNKDQALAKMREAADLEDSVDKHPVTPGAVLPARELYADMLEAEGKHAEALEAYQASLKISPNRYNSLFGAGLAAERQGNRQMATEFYQKLMEVAGRADADRSGYMQAKQFLGQ